MIDLDLNRIFDGEKLEDNRLECKRSWSTHTQSKIIQTITAFANDYENTNGGYVIIGAEDRDGISCLPDSPVLEISIVDDLINKIQGQVNRIRPDYRPYIETRNYQGHPLIIIFAPKGEKPPYQCPVDIEKKEMGYDYYVRINSRTQIPKNELLNSFLSAVDPIPFEERRHQSAVINDLSVTLVKEFMHNVGRDNDTVVENDEEIYTRLGLLKRVNGFQVPKNFSLLFFSERPREFLPGA